MRSTQALQRPPTPPTRGASEGAAAARDKLIERDYAGFNDPEYVRGFWEETLNAVIDVKRCGTIISKSEESIGENDFVFDWFAEPTLDQLKTLIKQVDDALAPLDVKYTITTK